MSMLDKANKIIKNKDVDSNLSELYSEIAQKIISKYKLNNVAIKQNQISLKDELQAMGVNMDNIMQGFLDIYYNNDSNDVSIDIYDYLEYIPKDEFLKQLQQGKYDEYIHDGVCVEGIDSAYSIIKFKDNTYNTIIQETDREVDSEIVFDKNFDNIKDCFIETCKLCSEIRIWHSYTLLCEYIDNMYNDMN